MVLRETQQNHKKKKQAEKHQEFSDVLHGDVVVPEVWRHIGLANVPARLPLSHLHQFIEQMKENAKKEAIATESTLSPTA